MNFPTKAKGQLHDQAVVNYKQATVNPLGHPLENNTQYFQFKLLGDKQLPPLFQIVGRFGTDDYQQIGLYISMNLESQNNLQFGTDGVENGMIIEN
jgi:hypothetical protein